MIIFIPEKFFKKKIAKFVKYKEFVICDATDRSDGKMQKYGNCVTTDEFAPTPTLQKIVLDPDSTESKIKRRNIQKYLEYWLGDEGLAIQMHRVIGMILKSYMTYGEDCNVFVVCRSKFFNAYHKYLEDKFAEDYGVQIATFITDTMKKSEIKDILKAKFSKSDVKTLKKAYKRLGKELNVKDNVILGMDD